MLTLTLFALSTALTLPAGPTPGDWSQYNGTAGDRRSSENLDAAKWSDDAAVAWRVPTRLGFSSFAVADGKAFTLVLRDGAETLVALSTEDGRELWARPLSQVSYDGGGDAGADGNKGGDGPRSTPSVDGELVYAFDAAFVLTCVDRDTGGLVWRRSLSEEFLGQTLRWQNAASPLVEGAHVFVAGGGAGKSLLAFDKESGELAWAKGSEKVTHATPVAATIQGKRQVLFYVQSGLVACDPADGSELWRAEYPYKVSSAASPVVAGDRVYVSAGYGVGAGLFRIDLVDGVFRPELVWQQRNKLMNHWSTPVHHDGFLYGMFSFKKYGEGPLCCVELETGEVRWSEPGFGPGNVIVVGDTLVALSDAGEVVLVELDPASYEERARGRAVHGKYWSSPAFAEGQLYVRSTEEGVRIPLGMGG